MRRINLKSVAKQYGMRQARIQARRGRRSAHSLQTQVVYNNDNDAEIAKWVIISIGILIIVSIFFAIQ